MIENNPTNVEAAFEMLLEEIEAEIDFIDGVGSKAFEKRDYERAKEALEHAGKPRRELPNCEHYVLLSPGSEWSRTPAIVEIPRLHSKRKA